MQLGNPSSQFTRPADTTAYASGDLVANSTTAGSVSPLSWKIVGNANPAAFRLTRVRMTKSGTTPTNANFRVHLYNATPTPANGDNGVWSTSGAAAYLGSIDVGSMKAFTDGCSDVGAASSGSELLCRFPTGTTIFGLVEARAAYTPISAEVFTVVLELLEAY